MRAGIELLSTDAEVFEAFKLANQAMAMAARQRSPDRYEPGNSAPQWRLFQLAFVLMNLPGLGDPKHPDRDMVDLIFFPTGGGKTEAYLGVIATTLLLRRIRARGRVDAGLGVAVLLRYTLRLLTLDQLGRAATLICALEQLRKGASRALGEVRFSIGLWVGRSATANTMSQVKDEILEFKVSASSTAPSPCPLTHCPWCQKALDRNSLDLQPSSTSPEEVIVGCVSATCAFSARAEPAGIPVVFVDEQIYRELPCFLVATVDKFAMLPWRGETGLLFGRASAREGRRFWGPLDARMPKGATLLPSGLRPPELIVQDELHLISGPLGTMVGLFETAIEYLSTTTASDGVEVRPKVIASTATVRRAREQICALFGRERMALFPPPGVNDSDTFFASVDEKNDGRLYVGVAAPGRAMKAILRRTYIDLLCAGRVVRGVRVDGRASARQQRPDELGERATERVQRRWRQPMPRRRDEPRPVTAIEDRQSVLPHEAPREEMVERGVRLVLVSLLGRQQDRVDVAVADPLQPRERRRQPIAEAFRTVRPGLPPQVPLGRERATREPVRAARRRYDDELGLGRFAGVDRDAAEHVPGGDGAEARERLGTDRHRGPPIV